MIYLPQTKRLARAFARLQQRFWSDRRGGVAIFIAAAIIPLIGGLGLATDVSRGYLVKSRLQDAVDAAALAGGKVMTDANRNTDIQSYFRANFPAGYMDAVNPSNPSQDPTPTISDNSTPSSAASTVTVTASARIPTTFMKVLGFDDITVSATATATKAVAGLDVVLAMDVSGSMGMPMSKMTSAQTAAKNLVSYLFGTATTSPTIVVNGTTYYLLNIGLVPWNQQVNVTRNGVAFTGATSTAVTAFTNPMTGASQSVLWYANNSPVPLLKNPLVYDTTAAATATTPAASTWSGAVHMRYTADGNNSNDGDFVLGQTTVGGAAWQGYQPANDYWAAPRSGNWNSSCVGSLSYGSGGCQSPITSGTALASAGTASYAFDGNTGTNTSAGSNGWVGYGLAFGSTATYRMVGIRHNSTTTLHLVFETATNSTFTTSVTTVATVASLAVTAGTMTWVDIPDHTARRYFRVRETGGSTLRPQELVFSSSGIAWDGESRQCYWAYWNSSQLTNSGSTGFPANGAELADRPLSVSTFDYFGTDSSMINSSLECDAPPTRGITDLTHTKSTIDTAIDQLTPGGHTVIPGGLYWGWEVVTPGGPYSAGVASPPFPRAQAIVLFTDGENQAMYGDSYRMSFGYDTAGATATTYGYLPSPAPANTYNNLNNRLVTMATAIKATGVRIYVVKYQHTNAANTALLQSVASGTGAPFYFDAADATELNDAFEQIAADLSKLRLSK
jgi:Flp pilus assembly protein TadG